MLTLGIALPWREASLERYKMRNTHYGDLQGRFEGTGWGLFKKLWWLALLFVVVVFILIAVPIVSTVLSKQTPAQLGAKAAFAFLQVFLNFLLPVSLPFMYAAYRAIVWRWWVSGIRFGAARFESDMRTGELNGIYWAVIGWAILIVILDLIFVGVAGSAALAVAGGGKINFDNATLIAFWRSNTYVLTGAFIINYLILALAIGTVMRIYLLRRVWAKVANSTTVHNLDAADNVTAVGTTANALGEGFANSLDIAGF